MGSRSTLVYESDKNTRSVGMGVRSPISPVGILFRQLVPLAQATIILVTNISTINFFQYCSSSNNGQRGISPRARNLILWHWTGRSSLVGSVKRGWFFLRCECYCTQSSLRQKKRSKSPMFRDTQSADRDHHPRAYGGSCSSRDTSSTAESSAARPTHFRKWTNLTT